MSFSLSANKCIQRTRGSTRILHPNSIPILSGVEQTLKATGMGVRRLTMPRSFK